MPVTPTGTISVGLSNLRDWISRTPTWKRLSGENSGSTSTNGIYFGAVVPDGLDVFGLADQQDHRPMAIVYVADNGYAMQRKAEDAFWSEAAFGVSVELDVPEGLVDSPGDAFIQIWNNATGIAGELLEAAKEETEDRIQIGRVTTRVRRSDADEAVSSGDYWIIDLAVETAQ